MMGKRHLGVDHWFILLRTDIEQFDAVAETVSVLSRTISVTQKAMREVAQTKNVLAAEVSIPMFEEVVITPLNIVFCHCCVLHWTKILEPPLDDGRGK